MGYNFSGIAIDKNLEGQVERFWADNGIKVQKTVQSVSIEEAMDGQQSNEIHVIFAEKGTLMFIPGDISLELYGLDSAEVLTFNYFETVMAFSVFLSKNNMSIREIMEGEGEVRHDEGTPLPMEQNTDSVSDWLETKVEEMTGFKMFGYEDDDICSIYKIVK